MPARAALAKIHIAIKELAIPDDAYRDILGARYRKRSARDLSDRQAADLLTHFRRLGWKPKRPRSGREGRDFPLALDPQSRKIRALWITLHQAGRVKNPSEAALRRYVQRMAGCDALQFCDQAAKHRIIEALKAWQRRE